MSTTGKEAWEKHFKGKGEVKTAMKNASTLYNDKGQVVGNVTKGTEVIALPVEEYVDKYPVKVGLKTGYVTFNNIQKPIGKSVSGIKLKPQDFKFFTKENWGAKELSKALISEVGERDDLEPTLKNYLQLITAYWGGEIVNAEEIRSAYGKVTKGIAEVQKDYGEMLGAIACCTKGVLKSKGITVGADVKINFPLRGNEPLVDYYIADNKNGKLSISAKSGETTNTLKPKDVLDLLASQHKAAQWKQKPVYKFMELVVDSSTVMLPFNAINMIEGKDVMTKAALAEASTFKTANFARKDYNFKLFQDLAKLVGIPTTTQPTIGQLFYATEKYVIKKANEKYPPGDIFKEATSNTVIYVKYEVSQSNPAGEFKVLASDATVIPKKDVYWRSKNSTARASDKIGLQP